jgi:hypothetical protein
MTYCPSVHTSISRKGRKKKLDTKRNKRQCVDSEDGIALEVSNIKVEKGFKAC